MFIKQGLMNPHITGLTKVCHSVLQDEKVKWKVKTATATSHTAMSVYNTSANEDMSWNTQLFLCLSSGMERRY